MHPSLSVVICTFNRAELLELCLQSLGKQSARLQDFEVIVVANNCTDSTPDVVSKAQTFLPNLRAVNEPAQGLSHARNRGAREVRTEWVFYLDDDALADQDMIRNALLFIREVGGKIFGGQFKPWYHYGRTAWFKDEYGSSHLKYTGRTLLTARSEFLTGGVFCVHVSLFERYGGFDPLLGMNGLNVGYGEETEYQKVLRKNGVDIWYDPSLVIEHVVKPQLLTPEWHLAAGWALGRDKVLSGNLPKGRVYLLSVALTAVVITALDAAINGAKLLLSKDYYPENWWIDTFRKAAKRAAILYTASLYATRVNRA